MNNELLNKARAAKSPEELLKLARENGMGESEFDEKSAEAYFDLIQRRGELSDDELENAAGGCRKGGKLVVSKGLVCALADKAWPGNRTEPYFGSWRCKTCKEIPGRGKLYNDPTRKGNCSCNRRTLSRTAYDWGASFDFEAVGVCGSCDRCQYIDGVWICSIS